MADRKPFLFCLDPALLDVLQRWVLDDLRSLNGQIEFVLRRALQQEGRAPQSPPRPGGADVHEESP